MDCHNFRARFDQFNSLPLSREITETDEYEEWVEHMHSCRECGDIYQHHWARLRGVDPGAHPCVHIAYHISQDPSSTVDPHDDPDVTLVFVESTKTYGIPVRDGGSSYIEIAYCPWCGTKLRPAT